MPSASVSSAIAVNARRFNRLRKANWISLIIAASQKISHATAQRRNENRLKRGSALRLAPLREKKLFTSQSLEWIDLRRAARGNPARQQRHTDQHDR